MRIAFINTNDIGSTGNICRSLCTNLINNHNDVVFITKQKHKQDCFVKEFHSSSIVDIVNKCYLRFTGKDCFIDYKNTQKIIKEIEKFKPDIIHIHNIHGSFFNIQVFLETIKKINIPIVWTLHDCWTFTGRCTHYDFNGCDKWRTQCKNCKFKHEYPKSLLFDFSKKMFSQKKSLFCGSNITFVTPSNWLRNQVQQSFLKNESVVLINNGIKKRVLINQDQISEKRKALGIDPSKKIIFSAAFSWTSEKGLDSIFNVAKKLESTDIIFIIAGLKKKFTKRKNILFIPKITNSSEMDLMFSLSDIFLNPTLQDTFPTVNIESIMNGTPVVTYDVGGSPEIINDNVGKVVRKGDIDALAEALKTVNKDLPTKNACLNRSENYHEEEMVSKYINLYEKILGLKSN